MRDAILFLFFCLPAYPLAAQVDTLKTFEPTTPYQLADTSRQTVFKSSVDPSWPLWEQRSYGYGLKADKTKIPLVIDAPLQVNSFLQLRTNSRMQRRWGYHFLEAYSVFDNISRFTMLMDKHIELGRPVAELYYFGNRYNTSEAGYNWVRIGSDVRGHSFLFSRDQAVFYGAVKLDNMLTLGNIGSSDLRSDKPSGGNGEHNTEEEVKFVRYKALESAGDGTIFYDKDRHLVVIKVDGVWMRLKVKKLPKGGSLSVIEP